jgi:hypothetical protein
MTRSSRFLLPFALVTLAASLAAGVPRAAATDPFPTTGVVTLSSAHFVNSRASTIFCTFPPESCQAGT